jgi:hypothetical protein
MNDSASSEHDDVCRLTDAINLVLAGHRGDLVETVLSLTVATSIVARYPRAEWSGIVKAVANQVIAILEDEKMVAFIKSGIRHEDGSEGMQ